MIFDDMNIDRQSRLYNPSERDSEEFVSLREAMGISRGAYRNWEYVAALKALGDIRGKRVLSVGAYNCALSLFLSHHASEFVACDRIAEGVKQWGEERGGWGTQTVLLEGDFSEVGASYPTGYFDAVVSIGAIEHASAEKDRNVPGDGDSRTMMQIGRVLAVDGVAAITTEWSYTHWYDPDFVGGWVYDTCALFKRLVEPSGLEIPLNRMTGRRLWLRSISWKQCIEDFPAIGKHQHPLCPVLLVLTHKGKRRIGG